MVVSVAGWLGIEAAQVSEANFSLSTGERSCVWICDLRHARNESGDTRHSGTHMRCRWDVRRDLILKGRSHCVSPCSVDRLKIIETDAYYDKLVTPPSTITCDNCILYRKRDRRDGPNKDGDASGPLGGHQRSADCGAVTAKTRYPPRQL